MASMIKNTLVGLSAAITLFHCTSICLAEPECPRIGVIAPMSGGLASYGNAIRNGISLAQEDSAPARRLSFIFEDDQYDGKKSVSAFAKLTDLDQVPLVLTFGSVAGSVTASLAESKKIPMLNFGGEHDFVVGKSYVARTLSSVINYSDKLAAYLRAKDIKQYSIVATDLSFIRSMTDSLQKVLLPNESVEIVASVLPSESDFRTIIARLKRDKVKAVGLFLLSEQVAAFVRQAHELSYSYLGYGTDFFESAATQLSNKSWMDGMVYADNVVREDYKQRYLKRFGNTEQITFGGSGYDVDIILGQLADAICTEKLQGTDLMKRFTQVAQAGEGVLGAYTFKDDAKLGKYLDYPIAVKQMKDGVGVAVAQPAPAQAILARATICARIQAVGYVDEPEDKVPNLFPYYIEIKAYKKLSGPDDPLFERGHISRFRIHSPSQTFTEAEEHIRRGIFKLSLAKNSEGWILEKGRSSEACEM